MRKSKFTESQIAAALKEADAGVAVAQIARKHGISAAPAAVLAHDGATT
jgi:putative transposase